MHSTIYELSEQPILESRRATIDSLPEWFFRTVADGATDMDAITRAVHIRCLEQRLGDLCTRDGDQLLFADGFKERYFRDSYPYFMAAAKALSHVSYAVFAGITPAPAFDVALDGVAESYADKFGFYIYDPDCEEMFPLDTWLRSEDLSKPHYVGAVMDYHA